MVNCNPETVSTDYDTSNRLYFEPLDVESVLAVCERERPEGVVIQFGGQTPLKLARAIEAAGLRILGTPFDAVDLAEDRERFGRLLAELGIRARSGGSPRPAHEAVAIARAHRLPGARAPVVRARRSRDARVPRGRRGRASVRGRPGPDARRPLPRERGRDRRRRALRRRATPTSPRSCSTSRRRASTRATPPACSRRSRSARDAARRDRSRSSAGSGPRSASSGCSTCSSRSPTARSSCSR